MKRPNLCECCSAVIAMVLLVADCRHLAMQAPQDLRASSSQTSTDWPRFLQVELQNGTAGPMTASLSGNDVMTQLSGLSAMASASAGYRKVAVSKVGD